MALHKHNNLIALELLSLFLSLLEHALLNRFLCSPVLLPLSASALCNIHGRTLPSSRYGSQTSAPSPYKFLGHISLLRKRAQSTAVEDILYLLSNSYSIATKHRGHLLCFFAHFSPLVLAFISRMQQCSHRARMVHLEWPQACAT